MIVVNLFGVPGAGKSTGAAYIFSKLKMMGFNAELITEFVKDKVWENNQEVFKNQAYIFGKQSFKMSRCKGKVDILVTDSPLLLSAFYNSDAVLGEAFNKVVLDVFNSYENINFLINRVKPYNPIGRNQTESESDAMKEPIEKMLYSMNISFSAIDGDIKYYYEIAKLIDRRMKMRKQEGINGNG